MTGRTKPKRRRVTPRANDLWSFALACQHWKL